MTAIEGQTSIPVPDEPTHGDCAWCGKPASVRIEMEPAVRGTDKATGVTVIKRHAIRAWACPGHLKSKRAAKLLTREVKKTGKGVVIR